MRKANSRSSEGMTRAEPPKRRIRKDGIPLNADEHKRFVEQLRELKIESSVLALEAKSGLYLRGRRDGPKRTGARPCGYLFWSEASFDSCHAPVAHIVFPHEKRPSIVFRTWKKGVFPFSRATWDRLAKDPRHKQWKTIDLVPTAEFNRALDLARTAAETFAEKFDLTVDRNG